MISRARRASLEAARRRAPGSFVRLGEGITHYRCEGPDDGPPMVLLHGATVPCWQFDPLVPALTAAGFRTLRFDFYGHGLSDRPPGPYSLERFSRQVCELMEATRFPRPTALLGHSLGAAVAAEVAALRGDWIERLVLVAPMLDFNATSPWSPLFRTPIVGELLMRVVGVPALVRRRRRRYARIGLPHLTPMFIDQVSHAGFGRALLSMIRTNALGNQSSRYAALRRFAGDLMVVTGTDDAVIPVVHIARIRALLPSHRHCEIASAEHHLLLTHPQALMDALRGQTVAADPVGIA